jgi:tetratricopeptide (TPR) repeat protein
LRTRPDYPEARNNLGIALKQKGDLPAAISQYEQAIRLRPDYLLAWVNLAAAYAANGEYPRAITAARRALELARAAGNNSMAAKVEQRLQNYELYRVNQEDEPFPSDASQ